jgi:hypothetical protein
VDAPNTLVVDTEQPTQWGRDVMLISITGGAVLVRPEYCVDRRCWCSKVELHMCRIDDQLARVIEHDGHHLELCMRSGCSVRPPIEFDQPRVVLELYGGRFSAMVRGAEDLAAAQAELEALGLRFEGEILDELWRRQARARGIDSQRMLRRPPKHFEFGNMLGWDEVCRDSRRDVLVHEGEYVPVLDYYCPAPHCTCEEVHVVFVDHRRQDIGLVVVDFGTGELDFRPAKDSLKQRLRSVWATYVERWPNYPARLRERHHALRHALRDEIEARTREFTTSETPRRRDEPKPARNQPCPCGSGRKFKRCCGA